jgi:DNA-binding transcriptional ArsR family regulator
MPVRQPWDAELGESAALIRSIAHPLRLRILRLLQRAEVCHCHFPDVLQTNEATTNRHLALLRRHKVIQATRGKYFTYFSLTGADSFQTQLLELITSLTSPVFVEDYYRLIHLQHQPSENTSCSSIIYPSAK